MYRGFSTLELLIALTIMASAIIASTQLVLGMPQLLTDLHVEYLAYGRTSILLADAEQLSITSYEGVATIASTTSDSIETALTVVPIYDELAARVTATAAWPRGDGRQGASSQGTLITDLELARDLSCSPLLSGNWSDPRIVATYQFSPGKLLPAEFPAPGSLGSVGILETVLVLATTVSHAAADPTLFFFTLSKGDAPSFTAAFDNAPTSRNGYTAVAVGGGHVYAANGFGSGSVVTCANSLSCAQAHTFSLTNPQQPSLVGSVYLATSSAPYAVTTSGSTASAKSIAYRRGYLYLGLEKTVAGNEFNIIDMSDPALPRWIAGVNIGRSVEAIAVTRTHVYLATSDSAAELVVIDIRDPEQPARVGSWDAPGAANFGIGSSISIRGPYAYFGRSYSSNAPEFYVLDVSDPAAIIPVAEENTGTALTPSSVTGTVVREDIAAVLSGDTLYLWNVMNLPEVIPVAASMRLESDGAALACKGNELFVVGTATIGTGILEIISSL